MMKLKKKKSKMKRRRRSLLSRYFDNYGCDLVKKKRNREDEEKILFSIDRRE